MQLESIVISVAGALLAAAWWDIRSRLRDLEHETRALTRRLDTHGIPPVE